MAYKNKNTTPIEDIDIDKPRHNLDTYFGRCKYFFEVTNPINAFATDAQLNRAKEIVEKQRRKEKQDPCVDIDKLYKSKILYDSAFHPETGEKQVAVGRMSAQVPVNTILTVFLTFFYKTVFSVVFWQWVNQSFNATVYYTNRSGTSEITTKQILRSYISATLSAVTVALTFKRLAKTAPPLISRFVPYVGCVGAHFVNAPLMRGNELTLGTTLYDENGKKVGQSKAAAKRAIAQVITTRIFIAGFPMLGIPTLMDYLAKSGVVFKNQFGVELVLGGMAYALSIPMSCAIFKQYQKIACKDLEEEAREQVKKNTATKDQPYACYVYYNKGL